MIRKIAESKELYRKKVQILIRNPIIIKDLDYLKRCIENSNKERALIGISKICRECGILKKDCCGKGVELKYSKELLIINMLLGVSIPEESQIKNKCHFLTDKGCLLLARDVFCVNYICRSIRESMPLKKLKRLQELENEELKKLFELEELIKTFL